MSLNTLSQMMQETDGALVSYMRTLEGVVATLSAQLDRHTQRITNLIDRTQFLTGMYEQLQEVTDAQAQILTSLQEDRDTAAEAAAYAAYSTSTGSTQDPPSGSPSH